MSSTTELEKTYSTKSNEELTRIYLTKNDPQFMPEVYTVVESIFKSRGLSLPEPPPYVDKSKLKDVCPFCNSLKIHKSFLGGSGKVGAIVAIAFGLLLLLSGAPMFGVLILGCGFAAFFVKKYVCLGCKKRFSLPKKIAADK